MNPNATRTKALQYRPYRKRALRTHIIVDHGRDAARPLHIPADLDGVVV